MIAKYEIFKAKTSLVARGPAQNFVMPLDEVCKFVTELGALDLIGISVSPPIVIVWYWDHEDEKEKETNQESKAAPS